MGKNKNNDANAVISAAPKKHKFDPAILVTLIIAVVVLAGTIAVLFYKDSDSYLRNQKAVSVGDVDINGVEYAYYYKNTLTGCLNDYYSYISYIGLDLSKPLDEQQCAFDSSKTWAQYFQDSATSAVQQMVVLNKEGEAAGFKEDEKVEEEVNKTIENL